MDKILLSILLFLPFSGFLIPVIDMWHIQGYFLQLGVLCLYSFKIYKKSKPLGCLLFWAGLSTIVLWVTIHSKSKVYATNILMPFFNLLTIVILFDIVTHLKKEPLNKFIKHFPKVILVLLIYCILQALNLDQFYKPFSGVTKDEIAGTIGNPMHLSHLLAVCLPFLSGKKILSLLCLAIVAMIGSTSGLCVSILIIILSKTFSLRELILLGIAGLLFLYYRYQSVNIAINNIFCSSHRFEMWEKYFVIFKQKPITGWGLGITNGFAQQPQFYGWRHLHCEIYQYALELGLIGAGIIGWGIFDYFKRFRKSIKTENSKKMALSFLAFVLCSFVGYPSHLWLIGIFALMAYSYQYLEA